MNGPVSTQPPPAPGGIQLSGGVAVDAIAFVQLCASYTPLPPILYGLPSNIGEFTGSMEHVRQMKGLQNEKLYQKL